MSAQPPSETRLLLLAAARERLRAHLEREAEALPRDDGARRQVERLAARLREAR